MQFYDEDRESYTDLEITPEIMRVCQIANMYNQLQSKRHSIRHKLRKLKINYNWKSSGNKERRHPDVTAKMQSLTLSELKYMVKQHSMLLSAAELNCHDHVKTFGSEFRALAKKVEFYINYDHSCYIYFYISRLGNSMNRHKIAEIALSKEIEDVLSS